jgi:uncharacterized sulfatase
LKADPDEVVNLIDSPKHQVKLRELRQAQKDWCRRIRDVGFLPEGEIHSRSRGSNPRDMALDETKYPFDRIFAAAERATMVGSDDLPFLQAFLKDSDSAVRYWGVMGVLIRGGDVVSKSKTELLAALKDESMFVRIVAAHALCKHGDADNLRLGLDCLVDQARWRSVDDVFVSLAAVNVLDSLDAKVALVRDAIKTLAETGPLPSKRYQGYVGRVLEKMRADLK